MVSHVYLLLYIHYRMGAGDLDHRQFAQQVDLYTGGLNLSPHICSHHSNKLGYEQVLLMYSFGLIFADFVTAKLQSALYIDLLALGKFCVQQI